MKKSNPKYQIYLKGLDKWTEVTEEYYYAYYRPIWNTRKKMQKKNKCCCPKDKLHLCDGICSDCKFYKSGSGSLNIPVGDGDICMEYTLFVCETSVESDYQEKQLIAKLYEEIAILPEIEKNICLLVLEGKTDTEIARALKLNHQANVVYRKRKAYRTLREKLEDF